MSKYKKYLKFDYIFPGAFAFLYYAIILLWLRLDDNLPHWDMGRHLYNTVIYDQLWQRVSESIAHLGSVVLGYNYYPPFVYQVGLVFEKIFGFSADAAVASNIIWILILAYSTYFLAKKLYTKLGGVIGLLVIFASPMLIGQFREFQLDMPLLSIFSISLLTLYNSEFLTKRRQTILFGLLAGIGMLVKWSFAFYIIPTGLIFLVIGLYQYKVSYKQILVNTGLALLLVLIIAGPWYLWNFATLKIDFGQNGIRQATLEGDPYGFNLAAYTWYLKRLISNYLFLPLFALACVGFLREIIKKRWLLSALFILFYLIISTLPNKDIRYLMPICIVLAMFIASLIEISKKQIYRNLFVVLVILIFIANNLDVSFGAYLPIKTTQVKIAGKEIGTIIAENGYTSNSPVSSPICPLKEIVHSIPAGSHLRTIGDSHMNFSDWAVAYFAAKTGRIWSGQTQGGLDTSDYLVYRNVDVLPGYTTSQEIYQKSIKVGQFDCIDGSKVIILQTRKQ